MKPPVASPEFRAQLDQLLRQTIDKINQDPSKAAIVLTDWVTSRPQKNAGATPAAQASTKNSIRKKAA